MPGLLGMGGGGPVPMNWLDQLRSYIPFGGPKDIELENESGMVDPRIPQPLAQLKKAFDTANRFTTAQQGGMSAVDALKKAGMGGQ